MKPIFRTIPSCLFILSVLFLACSQPKNSGQEVIKSETALNSRQCIDQIIAQDDSLGKVRNHACERISLAQTIREYTDAMGQFDYQNCPADFTIAFKKHREAWVALIPIVEKYPDMRGEMHTLFEILENGAHAAAFKLLVKAVWDTWGEVEEAMQQ